MLLLSLIALFVLFLSVLSSSTSVRRHIDVGIYANPTTISDREQRYGFHFQHLLIFQPVTDLDYSKIQTVITSGHEVILNMEFSSTLSVILDGTYDAQLTAFAKTIVQAGNTLTIRTLHEQNGDWYKYGLLVGGSYQGVNTLADYNTAWQRIIDLFAAAGADKFVKWQLNVNCTNGLDYTNPLSQYYPSTVDQYFDSVAITCYNRAFLYVNHNYSTSFHDAFIDAYSQIKNLTSKPLAIAETATLSSANGHVVDKVSWLTQAWQSIAVDFPLINQVTWFFSNKVEEGVDLTWDLGSQAQIDAYANGYRNMVNTTERRRLFDK